MKRSLATFLAGVAITVGLLFFVDGMGVSGPGWVILLLCSGLGLLLAEEVFRRLPRLSETKSASRP